MTNIQKRLFALRDLKYRDFHAGLIPGVDKERIIGVRVPALRNIAREIFATAEAERFLQNLPHRYFDENQLHALLLNRIKDYGECLERVKEFLPYVDNWATCDILRPPCFDKNHGGLIKEIPLWLQAKEIYTVRFGIEMLMVHFLEEDFRPEYLSWVADIQSEAYYVRMMQAWFFAEALVRQWDGAIGYLENKRLEPWTHNKAIQKGCESYRISDERKKYIKALKLFHVKQFQ